MYGGLDIPEWTIWLIAFLCTVGIAAIISALVFLLMHLSIAWH